MVFRYLRTGARTTLERDDAPPLRTCRHAGMALLGTHVPVIEGQVDGDLHPVALRLKVAEHRWLALAGVRPQADHVPEQQC